MTKILKLITNFENWYMRFFERAGIITGDITYKVREPKSRFTFKAQAQNTPFWIIQDMLYNNPYSNSDLSRLYSSNRATIIDIGGNIGSFSVLRALRAPKVRVFAYEADPKNYTYLQKNINDNELSERVSAYNYAVTGKSDQGLVKIYEHADKGSNSLHVRKDGFTKNNYQTVPSKSLSQIFADHSLTEVDMIKMDVEGSEYEILYNSRAQLQQTRFVAVEYHDMKGESQVELITFLESCDFDVSETTPHILQCVNKRFV